MLKKKMQDLTIGESLIMSAAITVVCYLPFLAHSLYEYVQERRYIKNIMKRRDA